MNNFFIILVSILVLVIAYFQCFNNENMILFLLGCFIAIPAIITAVVGIVTDRNFFEM